MSETVKQVRKDALDWVNGEEHTEEWDADVVITRCVKALDDLERERAEWEANAQRENAALVQAQQRIAALEAEAQDVQRVEAWRKAVPGRDVTCYLGPWRAMEINLTDTGFTDVACADSLAALGRMLKEGE